MDPLTTQLRGLSATASSMVRALESHVGDFQAQQDEILHSYGYVSTTRRAASILRSRRF